jgi:cytochrome c-type biogenesis protein CcmH
MRWFLLALMCLAAVGFIIVPLSRGLPGNRLLLTSTIILVVGLSAGLYYFEGSPNLPSGASKQPDVDAMVASLAERLERQPDDLEGWKMLGRSYMTLGNYPGAIGALEKAVALEDASNAETLVSLGVALAQAGGQQLPAKAISAFENALALAPHNPEALFWAGIGAFNRGDSALAVARWEQLLATNPPEEIRAIIEQRIASWRGEAAPAGIAPAAQTAVARPVVTVKVTVSAEAAASLPADASVFIIARDAAQPSPPIAVTRRQLMEFPGSVSLGDQDSMIPGRSLSGFAEFELLVRASASGQPMASPGDWYGTAIVRPADESEVELQIGTEVR